MSLVCCVIGTSQTLAPELRPLKENTKTFCSALRENWARILSCKGGSPKLWPNSEGIFLWANRICWRSWENPSSVPENIVDWRVEIPQLWGDKIVKWYRVKSKVGPCRRKVPARQCPKSDPLTDARKELLAVAVRCDE